MRVGFVQNKPIFAGVRENLAQIEELLAGQNADLFVLPELFATGYQFKDLQEARSLAELVPGGVTTSVLTSIAKKTNTFIIAGLAEIAKDKVYNSAIVTGPNGYVGKYRKLHLFDTEKECFQKGNLPLKVFDIAGAKVGVMICFDWRFPETARALALMGADLIAHPANLVLPHCPQAMVTRCLENRVFAVTADRVGTEGRLVGEEPLNFIGQSQVVDPGGNILVRASMTDEEVHVVELDLSLARDKFLNSRNHIFNDRRTDMYLK
ncbi:MAG: acyltransferase [Nitrospinae bacterium CG22_combo_CG10-13_8_21_14_all_47_10]|jgi:predicted amidohydrolase|nr:MAG: acyltransferase [Nitrospinae bacterium CG22_combo_CG10-13_8_21_14_all_47_10]